MKSGNKITVKAYAKVNLFLDITGRLENGYHSLNTVMQQLDIYDIVEVEIAKGDGIRIECSNPDVPCNENNIAYKAAKAFLSEKGESADVFIKIQKNIPLEAGMGGSSTDGAAVLTALNRLYGNCFCAEKLCEMGAELGADVPFCITGGTAVCKGIGEIITPAECKKDYVFAIVKPDFSCSTPSAYKAYDKNPITENTDFESFVSSLLHGCGEWGGKMYNVFERLYNNPEIRSITEVFKKSGAVGSILTGSGSAVFGVFKTKAEAEKALENFNFSFKISVFPV